MTTNIVCSDTYIDAFSKLDKKTQKKSMETIRLMQRSLRSDSLKVEKLNTKLEFKSARVTQDFRVIFTQSGNTVLLVYIGHHNDAYLWASNKLQGFDVTNAKPAYEYFEQAKKDTFDASDSAIQMQSSKQSKKIEAKRKTDNSIDTSDNAVYKQVPDKKRGNYISQNKQSSVLGFIKKLFFAFIFFLLGALTGLMITVMHFM